MPAIVIIEGVEILVQYHDHAPPHFHAKMAGQEAQIAILTLEVLRGSLAAPRLRKALAWAGEHQGDLAMHWRNAQNDKEKQTMPDVLENVIVAALPDPAAFRVALTWANGEQTTSDFSQLASRGIMKRLADPACFSHVRVGELGRSLEWNGGLDFCADAIWFEAHPDDNSHEVRLHQSGRDERLSA